MRLAYLAPHRRPDYLSTIAYSLPSPEEFAAALALHRRTLVADGHCDSILDAAAGKRSLTADSANGHLDFPRARQGGISLQVFTAWPSPEYYRYPARRTFELLEHLLRQLEAAPEQVRLCRTTADIDAAFAAGRLGALLNVEGGEVLEGSLEVLHILYRLGVRVLQPVWNYRNDLADGLEHTTGTGLTAFGRAVVREMNALGMVLDLSHLPPEGFAQVLELSTQPVLFTHGNCRARFDHRRNLTDGQIRALAAQGGVLGISFVNAFMGLERVHVGAVADHIDHAVQLLGSCAHVAYGSDYDGTDVVPVGLENASRLPNLTAELLHRGYREADLTLILGGNYRRVLGQVLGE